MPTNLLNPFEMFGGFSAEAQAVIDLMTGLTNDEKDFIATFVDAEVLNGNWNSNYDEFWCCGLVTEANALIGWKGIKTATNNGATKVSAGFSFDGISDYINSNFNPATDSVNYALDDALVGGYYSRSGTTNDELIGLRIGTPTITMRLRSTSRLDYSINSTLGGVIASGVTQEALLTQARTTASLTTIYEDGSSIDTDSASSTSIPSNPFYIGARNLNGSPAAFFNGTISSIIIGAGVGFDQSEHNTNLNTLLTSLGAI